MTNLFVSSVSYHIYRCENNQYIVKVVYCKLLWFHILEKIFYRYLSLVGGNRSSGFATKSDTNQAVLPQKMAKGLTFWIYV